MTAHAAEIHRTLERAGLSCVLGADLREHTTFRIGGRAEILVTARKPDQILTALEIGRSFDARVFCLGGGSNVLISDDGVRGIVILNRIGGISFDGETATVGGGHGWDDLVSASCDEGLDGISGMSGIPGSTGGAIHGNAGAYGDSVSDSFVEATVVDRHGSVKRLTSSDLGFRYRYSRLKETGQIVLSATFRLRRGDRKKLIEHRDAILTTRAAKHPGKHEGTAGSFFKNIEALEDRRKVIRMLDLPDNGHRIAAGILLDRVGARGMRVGDAEVFEKHANIIVNRGHASAVDVLRLSLGMYHRVLDEFAISLEREVMWVGGDEPIAVSAERNGRETA